MKQSCNKLIWKGRLFSAFRLLLIPLLLLARYGTTAAMVPAEPVEAKNHAETLRDSMVDQVILQEKDFILATAGEMLKKSPRTVTASFCQRSAGGKHDFYSEGPYWWPDPANPNGPYIRRDGIRNPDRFEDHDNSLREFSWTAGTLAAAWLLTGDPGYVKAAMNHYRAWFADTTTRMNPNMLYAQAVRGVNTGRGTGIIDAVPLIDIARAAIILEQSGMADPAETGQIKSWFSQFTGWLNSHPYGLDEKNAKNNHGTWWYAQVASYAALTGEKKIADMCRKDYRSKFLPAQMAADGSFPLELERTKPYSYSLFNLDAFSALAWILSGTSREDWDFTLPDSRGLQKGLSFIRPYIFDKSRWPYQQDVAGWAGQPEPKSFMLLAALMNGDRELFRLWSSLLQAKGGEKARIGLPLKNPLIWILEKPVVQPSGQSSQKGPLKVILKLDDLQVKNGECPCRETLDWLVSRKIRASFGAIANRLDPTSGEVLKPYLAARDDAGKPLVEIWNHGLDHVRPEFQATPYAYQQTHFWQADSIIRKRLGIVPRTFGAPFNAIDSVTCRIMSEAANYRAFLFPGDCTPEGGKVRTLNNRVNIEQGTGNPDFGLFLENFEKSNFSDFIVLQAHPNGWDVAKKEQYERIVTYLQQRNCIFVLPGEM